MDSTTGCGPSPSGRYSQAGICRPSCAANVTRVGSTVPFAVAEASVTQCEVPSSRSTASTLFGRAPVDTSAATMVAALLIDSDEIGPAGIAGTARSAPTSDPSNAATCPSDAPLLLTAQTIVAPTSESPTASTSQSGVTSQLSSRLAR